MPIPGDRNGDGTLTYGTCWSCGTEGWLMRVLGGNLLCRTCWDGIRRVDAGKAGETIANHWAELRKLEER